jgi:hypothetical protein
VTDSGLGRIDLLFALLKELELNTPDNLDPYLKLLNKELELERRPLAEQIIDVLTLADASHAKAYLLVRAKADASRAEQAPSSNVASEVGEFVGQWARLERLLRILVPPTKESGAMPISWMLQQLPSLTPDMRFELDQLRRIRNELVHGIEVPLAAYLQAATQRLEALIEEIESTPPAAGEDSRGATSVGP